MEQFSDRELKRAINQQVPGPPTPPEQIWALLTPQQQREVFQRLVGLCQGLLHNHPNAEPEVPHEPV
jgi:hypothetical protein